uniref:Uncharacterized protein n=1 Tax=Crocodylus porosus TaxID=8502 RepID=A0A7M4FLL5_CROPO
MSSSNVLACSPSLLRSSDSLCEVSLLQCPHLQGPVRMHAGAQELPISVPVLHKGQGLLSTVGHCH